MVKEITGTMEEERAVNKAVATVPVQPARSAKFLSCPKCGDAILKEIAEEKEVCDECEIPFVDEVALARAKAKADAAVEAKATAVAKAREDLAKVLAG